MSSVTSRSLASRATKTPPSALRFPSSAANRMSRSRVSRAEPWSSIAIPPITTKSTPAFVRRRSMSSASRSGHSAGRLCLGSTALPHGGRELPQLAVRRREVPEPLGRGLAQVRNDHRLVEGGIRARLQLDLDRVSRCRDRPLKRVETRVCPGGLEARDRRLRSFESVRELRLGETRSRARALEEWPGSYHYIAF